MEPKKNEKLQGLEGNERISESHMRPEIREAKEFRKEAAEVVESVEAREGKEAAVEFAEGKISETVREDKKKGPAGKGAGGALTADEIEAIRAKLLANLPPQAVMMKQIRKKLMKDEKHLNKEFKQLKRMGHTAAFQLNRVVAQLRKIHEFFSLLAHATFDMVKQLWLKIVHGV